MTVQSRHATRLNIPTLVTIVMYIGKWSTLPKNRSYVNIATYTRARLMLFANAAELHWLIKLSEKSLKKDEN